MASVAAHGLGGFPARRQVTGTAILRQSRAPMSRGWNAATRNLQWSAALLRTWNVRPSPRNPRTEMTDEKLKAEARSAGHGVFVRGFDLFSERLTDKECIPELMRLEPRKNRDGASRSCGSARRIFEARREIDALRLISKDSKNEWARGAAARKLRELDSRRTK